MKLLKSSRHAFAKNNGRTAFTLTEVLVAAALTSIIMTAVVATMYTLGKSHLYISTRAEMDIANRFAEGTFARDIRSSRAINSFTNNILTLTGADGVQVQYTWTQDNKLIRQRAGATSTLLYGCTNFSLSFFSRPATNSNASFGSLSTTNANNAGLISIEWTCVRSNGSTATTVSQMTETSVLEVRNH